MNPALTHVVNQILGTRVTSMHSVAGGDINEAKCVVTSTGEKYFLKTHASAPSTMFETEARGLTWLNEANAIRIPSVIAHAKATSEHPAFLLLEWIEQAPKARHHDEVLGQNLAALHRYGAPTFGLTHNNFIGSLAQTNTPDEDWCSFYREQRLEPQLRLAVEQKRISSTTRQRFEHLFAILPAMIDSSEPPSRLHGDLWGGNAITDEQGLPCLIDPAVYGGSREIDLAMMRLFGGFSERVFEAYEATWPLPQGHEQRIALYQLYPLLVHANLFGGAYVSNLERTLRSIV